MFIELSGGTGASVSRSLTMVRDLHSAQWRLIALSTFDRLTSPIFPLTIFVSQSPHGIRGQEFSA